MRLIECLRRLRRDQSGASAVEYSLIAAMIVLGMIVALAGVGQENVRTWNKVEGALPER